MKRATILSGVIFALLIGSWAVPLMGAAHLSVQSGGAENTASRLPVAIHFRETKTRGLLIAAWINGRGPYTLAIDTGAGITILTERVAAEAGLRSTANRSTVLAGLSGREVAAGEATVDRIALGEPDNRMPARIRTIIASYLPAGIDGVLDPTDVYAPLGYTIDFPKREMTAFDPNVDGLSAKRQPPDGAVVPWLRQGQTARPFVRLSDGRLALLDTGSSFGLAISTQTKMVSDHSQRPSRDLGGGAIHSERVAPTTVEIGSLVLRGVPTDVLSGVEKGAPTILGRDALYPFRISFDPLRRLIQIAPSLQDND